MRGSRTVVGKPAVVEPFPGEKGFLLLEYIGGSKTVREWEGYETGTRYEFGPGTQSYVDTGDAMLFLHPAGGGKAFRAVVDDSY